MKNELFYFDSFLKTQNNNQIYFYRQYHSPLDCDKSVLLNRGLKKNVNLCKQTIRAYFLTIVYDSTERLQAYHEENIVVLSSSFEDHVILVCRL